PELAVLRLGVDSAKQSPSAAMPEPEVEVAVVELAPAEVETQIEEPAIEVGTEAAAAPAMPRMSQPWPQARPAAPAPQAAEPKAPALDRPVLQELVSDLEASLGDDFLGEEKPHAAPVQPLIHTTVPKAHPEVASGAAHFDAQEFRSGSLDDFVSDLEASLGGEPAEVPAQAVSSATVPMAHAAAAASGSASHAYSAPKMPVPARVPTAPETSTGHFATATPGTNPGIVLADMFGELKQELEGEATSTDEDPETHYNLGVAFREMGLLDEAIGEFQ